MRSNLGQIRTLGSVFADPQGRTTILRAALAFKNMQPAECPCCGYTGKFAPAGLSARLGQKCPGCEAYERHRLIAIALQRDFLSVTGKDVIHFAPERSVSSMLLKQRPRSYVTADVTPGVADRTLDIEKLDLPDSCFDVAFVSHVLEHVDDRTALSELRRILRSDGELVALVPLVEGWDSTYENPSITDPEERTVHFGRPDHLRIYGADFRKLLHDAGFCLAEFTAGPVDSPKFKLERGEKIFLGKKAANEVVL